MGEFGGLWSLSNSSSFPFVASVNLTPANNPSSATYSFTLSLASIGLSVNAGQSFTFVTTYLNGLDAFRSGEAIGNDWTNTTFDPNGHIAQNTATASTASIYTTAPEPQSIVMALAGAVSLAGFRRRRF